MMTDSEFFDPFDGPFWAAVEDWHLAERGARSEAAGDKLDELVRRRIAEAVEIEKALAPKAPKGEFVPVAFELRIHGTVKQ